MEWYFNGKSGNIQFFGGWMMVITFDGVVVFTLEMMMLEKYHNDVNGKQGMR